MQLNPGNLDGCLALMLAHSLLGETGKARDTLEKLKGTGIDLPEYALRHIDLIFGRQE